MDPILALYVIHPNIVFRDHQAAIARQDTALHLQPLAPVRRRLGVALIRAGRSLATSDLLRSAPAVRPAADHRSASLT